MPTREQVRGLPHENPVLAWIRGMVAADTAMHTAAGQRPAEPSGDALPETGEEPAEGAADAAPAEGADTDESAS